MKKIISGILTLIIVTFGISAFAFSDIDNSKYKDNIEFLEKYEIISGDNGKFNPNSRVTRAEAVKMMMSARHIDDKAMEYPFIDHSHEEKDYTASIQPPSDFSYADLSSSHWAYNCLRYAGLTEFISGFEDGTVHPNDDVTYIQFLTMAVKNVGYESYAEEAGGYPKGYYIVAKTLNITGGIGDFDLNTPITREMSAQILYHTVNTPMLASTGFDVGGDEPRVMTQVADGTDGIERTTLMSKFKL